MRQKNLELMEQIIKYVDNFYEANGRSPNIAEIATALKVNRSQVHRYLVFLEEKGLVEYSRDAIKTETMMKMARSNVTSIVGTIPCGPPDGLILKITVSLSRMTRSPMSFFLLLRIRNNCLCPISKG